MLCLSVGDLAIFTVSECLLMDFADCSMKVDFVFLFGGNGLVEAAHMV